jgi:putative phosphoribosyl transferase
MIHLPFRDRFEAGHLLGGELAKRNLPENSILLALPRGGVVVAAAVASVLHLPLDFVVVRKIGVPWQPELAIGAIAGDKVQTLDRNMILHLQITRGELDQIIAKETAECRRREQLYRHGKSSPILRDRTVILVDDGLATGSSMLAAVRYVKSLRPARVIVAVPVAARETCEQMKAQADDCICLATPDPFFAVGEWYRDFRQVRDSEVRELLTEARLVEAG